MTYPAGRLQCRARFERRVVAADDYGNERAEWSEVATLACGLAPTFGVEQVEAGALTSGLRGVVTLHAGASARGLRPEDRLIFVGGPYKDIGALQIRSIQPRPDAATIELNVESGAPT